MVRKMPKRLSGRRGIRMPLVPARAPASAAAARPGRERTADERRAERRWSTAPMRRARPPRRRSHRTSTLATISSRSAATPVQCAVTARTNRAPAGTRRASRALATPRKSERQQQQARLHAAQHAARERRGAVAERPARRRRRARAAAPSCRRPSPATTGSLSGRRHAARWFSTRRQARRVGHAARASRARMLARPMPPPELA